MRAYHTGFSTDAKAVASQPDHGLEQRGTYHKYGAPNAAYRTAALKRLSRPTGIPRK
ncbi:hypothetical protein [uncultured Cohaesibacter sp.]|uniref:hypothetical protein n=1 Tax=uncultured Cohaesibacter sp. TaxID=1002546 RepID=UPI0029C6318F|nr:hypothetical protein [uncultured Cohaesibacter sp.]